MAYIHVETKPKVYAKVYRVYSGNMASADKTVNIKTEYPEVDYTQLTNDDFVCTYHSDSNRTSGDESRDTGQTYSEKVNAFTLKHSYNASTGVLSITRSTTKASSNFTWSNLNCSAYMIVDGVREQYVK